MPVCLPELHDDVNQLPCLKLVEVYVLLRGERRGALESFLSAVQVGHWVRDAKMMSQGRESTPSLLKYSWVSWM